MSDTITLTDDPATTLGLRGTDLPTRADSLELPHAAAPGAPGPSLRITGVRTVNQQGQNASLFDPFGDALALTLDLQASADLLALPQAAFSAEFQIIDVHQHKVVVSQGWGSTFNWGPAFWISLGNNWGPPASYTTPEKWGLNWTANSIFGFRGIVKAQYIPSPGSGWEAVDAFDVSTIRWFRIRERFRL